MGMLRRDQLGREVEMPEHPERIISLCPSLTETLFALGVGDRVVGRTRHCIHPQGQVKRAQNVGGTKDVHEEVIASLNPDLILCEKEENTKEIVDSLSTKYPVYVVDVHTVEDALTMVADLGVVVDARDEAQRLVQEIRTELQDLPTDRPRTMAYLIWKDPYMAAGGDTYLDSLLTRAGFVNVFGHSESRYPQIAIAQLQALSPDVVFLSSEPYPFKEAHRANLQSLLPDAQVKLIDGEICWNGARMRYAVSVLRRVQKELEGISH
ncbi:MAG: helical backbone metal receptor [Firmicutes bacterium]|nr:helical backbone metal receptor [Bacillota bacterium]